MFHHLYNNKSKKGRKAEREKEIKDNRKIKRKARSSSSALALPHVASISSLFLTMECIVKDRLEEKRLDPKPTSMRWVRCSTSC